MNTDKINLDWMEYRCVGEIHRELEEETMVSLYLVVTDEEYFTAIPHIHVLGTLEDKYTGIVLQQKGIQFFDDKTHLFSVQLDKEFQGCDIICTQEQYEYLLPLVREFLYSENGYLVYCINEYMQLNQCTFNLKWLWQNRKYIKLCKFTPSKIWKYISYLFEEYIIDNITFLWYKIKNIYYEVRRFFRFIKRLIRYCPSLYNMEEWEMNGIYNILERKLQDMLEYEQKYCISADTKLSQEQINECLEHLRNYVDADELIESPIDKRNRQHQYSLLTMKCANENRFYAMPRIKGEEDEWHKYVDTLTQFENDNFEKFWEKFKVFHRMWGD